ncbi:hypothetical protein [Streptomyces sp. NPDC002133]|uniref:hypothetical protein n=1 Tax=Streptomyces sp. NPDC002133 TaxID=3154409 RepID=UPI0033206E98
MLGPRDVQTLRGGLRQGERQLRALLVLLFDALDHLHSDIGWAALSVELLGGSQVPMERSAVCWFAWESNGLRTKVAKLLEDGKQGTGPRDLASYGEIILELLDLGVMTERTNKSIDLPDIYRLAFEIGRKGGVARKPVA